MKAAETLVIFGGRTKVRTDESTDGRAVNTPFGVAAKKALRASNGQ